jgi:hypothetical protein
MTDPIDTAALRARYNGSGVARRCQKEQDVIFDDIMALCDALDAARLKSANREKLVRDAYNFAERMLPVVEAARAWYANESGDGQEYFRVTSDLCAAVAAYEAQQEKPVDHMLEAAKIYGSELAGRPDAPFVVQPSPVSASAGEALSELKTAAGDPVPETFKEAMEEVRDNRATIGSLQVENARLRASLEAMTQAKDVLSRWHSEAVAENVPLRALIATKNAALQEAAEALDDAAEFALIIDGSTLGYRNAASSARAAAAGGVVSDCPVVGCEIPNCDGKHLCGGTQQAAGGV